MDLHLGKLNPLNIGQGNKVQHPKKPGYSNTISQNVEGMHREFVGFQNNLKQLVTMFKTRQELMEALNENGLYTAKCFDEMLRGTPLESVVAPGGGRYKHENSEKREELAAPASREVDDHDGAVSSRSDGRMAQSGTFQYRLSSDVQDEDIDVMEYPDTSSIRERLDPDEGSLISQRLSMSAPSQEPEGLKASRMLSLVASDAPQLVSDPASRDTEDPPSDKSIKPSGADSERRESSDPPSKNPYPEDEDISVEKSKQWEDETADSMAGQNMGGGMNVIVDDDEDSFTQEVLEKGKGYERIKDTEYAASDEEEIVVTMEEEAVPATSNALVLSAHADGSSSDSSAPDDSKPASTNPFDDAPLVAAMVVSGQTKSQPDDELKSFAVDYSYFDVNKALYKDKTSKLEEHYQIVQYVEQWMGTVSTRVQGRYLEYCKHRQNLNHYNSKVDSLVHEQDKMQEKNKPMKPKQMEKLERNQVKLAGAIETHDKAGESLLMLMDEVIHRGWRDAFPLLKRSINFECEFTNITNNHLAMIGRSLQVLDIIGDRESIPAEGRFETLQKGDPEDFFSGYKVALLARSAH